jgi:probable DNA repair protein
MSGHVDSLPKAAAHREMIDAALLRVAVLLTPHARLARAESAAFDAARHAEGAKLWQPAAVLPWRAWTASLWRDALVAGVESRVLLNELQERALWEEVVGAGSEETLRSGASLARLCASATSLLGAYDVRGEFGRGGYHSAADGPDAETFARWWIRFEARCSADGWLPPSHADGALAEHVRAGRIAIAAEYLLHGFDVLTPAQAQLAGALEEAGAVVVRTSLPERSGWTPSLATCASADEEMSACAAWARLALERPGARVAVVVPDLEACRPVLERALRAAVAPELADVTAGGADAPYEFSTGRALASLPMIEDALRLLRWCAGEVSVEDAGAVLRSRFIALVESPERGAELDAFVLREKTALRALISMAETARWMDQATSGPMRKVLAAAKNLDPRHTTHAVFADGVRGLLKAAGWVGAPGASAALSSEEHQAVDRWDEVLDRVASLDALGLRVTFAAFLQRLAEAARDAVFAPENTGAPLQVTTVAEGVGREVDALWFLHADERTWPPRMRPHPLLPIALQRALRMPGADAREDELAASRLLDGLLRGAGSAVFSYARMNGESVQRPSPLVSAIALSTVVAEGLRRTTDESELEVIEDVAPLPALPEGAVHGGVGVLSSQALCGFRAFAEKRLFSAEMEKSAAGLTAGERGEQAHRVLELFWKKVGSQAELKAMMAELDDADVSLRDRFLMECIDEVVAVSDKDGWEAEYLDVQRKRLFLLLKAWLDFEAERPPFLVEAIEMKAEAEVGPLRLNVRVDRIDRVKTGDGEAALLIDYKTGSAIHRKAEWQGERMSEPQLPVYAIAGGIEGVQGIAFGAVKVGKLGNRFEGIADDPKMLSTRAVAGADFALQMETWQTDLTRLAEAFAGGAADVSPKEYPKTCDLCAQRMLCRLEAATLLDLEDIDEDDDDEGMPW